MGGIVGNRITWTGDVIVSRHILVLSLMDAELAEEVSRGFVGGCASFLLPIKSSKIVRFAENGAFAYVERLG